MKHITGCAGNVGRMVDKIYGTGGGEGGIMGPINGVELFSVVKLSIK